MLRALYRQDGLHRAQLKESTSMATRKGTSAIEEKIMPARANRRREVE
jgi:hypothetical protein